MLLVEDNQLNAEIAAELLRMSGLTVDCAWDGIEAVDCLFSCPDGYYDMVFMDIQMPRMNGYDATRAIRSSARDYCKRVPIVAMTANAFAEDVQVGADGGVSDTEGYSGAGRRGKGCPFPNPVCIPYICFSHAWMYLFQWFRLCGRDKVAFQLSP